MHIMIQSQPTLGQITQFLNVFQALRGHFLLNRLRLVRDRRCEHNKYPFSYQAGWPLENALALSTWCQLSSN